MNDTSERYNQQKKNAVVRVEKCHKRNGASIRKRSEKLHINSVTFI